GQNVAARFQRAGKTRHVGNVPPHSFRTFLRSQHLRGPRPQRRTLEVAQRLPVRLLQVRSPDLARREGVEQGGRPLIGPQQRVQRQAAVSLRVVTHARQQQRRYLRRFHV